MTTFNRQCITPYPKMPTFIRQFVKPNPKMPTFIRQFVTPNPTMPTFMRPSVMPNPKMPTFVRQFDKLNPKWQHLSDNLLSPTKNGNIYQNIIASNPTMTINQTIALSHPHLSNK